jgi:hypothetical protein
MTGSRTQPDLVRSPRSASARKWVCLRNKCLDTSSVDGPDGWQIAVVMLELDHEKVLANGAVASKMVPG